MPPARSGASAVTAADACPGILDLHEARDGYVARIRLPGGYASATTLRSLAALASRFGSGFVDLTARGNLQLRGVRAAEAGQLARRAAAAGLLPSPAHDRARNITASPLAGLPGHPDLRRLVRALDRALRADPGLAVLPGRFLFCLDDGTGRAGLSGCDVGVRCGPIQAECETGPREPPGPMPAGLIPAGLILAGRETGLRGPAEDMVRLAIRAARAFARQREEAPDIVRMSSLPDGGAGIAAALGGTLGERAADTVSRLPLGPVPVRAAVAAGTCATSVVVAAPLARLTAPQLRLLGRMVRPGEAARLTAAGRVVLPLAPADTALARPADTARPRPAGTALARFADAALAALAEAGLLVSDDHILSVVTACSGMSCASSLADVRSRATRVPGLAAVHWAGCQRRCGLPADATAVVAMSADQFAIASQGAPVRQAAAAGQACGSQAAAAGQAMLRDGADRAMTVESGKR